MYCSKCGREYSLEEGNRFCPSCGNRLSSQEYQHSCPWENLETLGFLDALGSTLRESLFSPVRFFSSMPTAGGWLHPILYAVIVGTAGNLAGYLLSSFFEIPFVSQGKLSRGMVFFMAVIMPVLVWLGTIFGSAILHGSILLFGAKKEPFEATLRIVSYATSPDVFNAIPAIGWLIAALWKVVLIIIGVREVHMVSTARATLVTLFPFLLIWGVLFVVILVMMATAVMGIRSI